MVKVEVNGKQFTDKVIICAIGGLVILQLAAMYFGVNHTLRTYTVAAIAGITGWRIPFKLPFKVKK